MFRWVCADSARARHPVHGDVGEGQHQHRPRLQRAGRGHPGQDGGPRGRCRPLAHRRGAPAVARAAHARLLLHVGRRPGTAPPHDTFLYAATSFLMSLAISGLPYAPERTFRVLFTFINYSNFHSELRTLLLF